MNRTEPYHTSEVSPFLSPRFSLSDQFLPPSPPTPHLSLPLCRIRGISEALSSYGDR